MNNPSNQPNSESTHCPRQSALVVRVRKMFLFCLTLLVGAVIAPQVMANTNVWFGNGTGNWGTGANWTNATLGGVGIVPAAGDDVKFYDAGNNGLQGVVNNIYDGTGTFGGTIASLAYGNTNGYHTTQIGTGVKLQVTGINGLVVGTPTETTVSQQVYATIVGAGSLVVSNASANIVVNQGWSTTSTAKATLDMQALSNLVVYVNRIGLGTSTLQNPSNTGQREVGILYLSATNNITLTYTNPPGIYQTLGPATNALEIGNIPSGNNATLSCFLYLGQVNNFFVDSIGAGRCKTTAVPGTMQYNPNVANGTAVFRGVSGGTNRVTWWGVGDMGPGGSSAQDGDGTIDFSGGSVDALVDTLCLGRDTPFAQTGSSVSKFNKGTFTFSAGTVDVNTLYLGNQAFTNNLNASANIGVMNVNGGTLKVNTALNLGNTTTNAPSGLVTSGMLSVGSGGQVWANTINVGPVLPNTGVATGTNTVVDSGTLVVSNTIGSGTYPLRKLVLNNGILNLNINNASTIAYVSNLNTAGSSTLNLTLNPSFSPTYPATIHLIQYQTFNGLGTNAIVLGQCPTLGSPILVSNSVNSSLDVVFLDPRISISLANQPSAQAVAPGTTVQFSVFPSGAQPITYQWYLGSTKLTDGTVGGVTTTGSTSNILTMVNVQTGNQGGYHVGVTNILGGTNSVTAGLTVSSTPVAPSIAAQDQPIDDNVNQHGTANFNCGAIGLPAPTFQWRRHGTNITDMTTPWGSVISGSATPNLQISNVNTNDVDGYSCGATNSQGGIVSSTANLTVNVAPTITVPPVSLAKNVGQSASFSVTDAGGIPASTYQWLFNGIAISGATNSTYSIASVAITNAGTYKVIVINPAGSPTASATLTVNSPMTVTSLSPTNGASGVCVDTPLRITFNQPPVVGTAGQITIVSNGVTIDTIDLSLNGQNGVATAQPRYIGGSYYTNVYPVFVVGNTATIYPHLDLLTNNTTYSVLIQSVPFGAFMDTSGASFVGIASPSTWQFTTKASGPANPTNLVVAADGSGDFCQVQAAIDYCGSNQAPVIINIKNGIYQEIVNIPTVTLTNAKPVNYSGSGVIGGVTNVLSQGVSNITLRGQSRIGTIITYPNNANLNTSTGKRCLMAVNANDITIENLTLTNSTPSGGSAAEALYVNGQDCIANQVEIDSYQDTLLVNSANSTLYMSDSTVQTASSIWGTGILFATNCDLVWRTSGATMTSARTPQAIQLANNGFGFAFVNCQLNAASGVTNCYLGVDAGTANPDANVAYFTCTFDTNNMNTAFWSISAAQDTNTVAWWEYQNVATNGSLVNTIVPPHNPYTTFSVQLPSGGILGLGSVAQLETPLYWFNGNWIAPTISAPAYVATQPSSQSVSIGQPVNLVSLGGGVEEPTYQWFKDNVAVGGATAATLTFTPGAAATNNYYVVIQNSLNIVTSTVVSVKITANAAPTLAQVPAFSTTNINPGITLYVTNRASDANLPSDTETFAFAATPPIGASLVQNLQTPNTNGVFVWRPTVSQTNSSSVIKVKVTDSGGLSATNTFTVNVNSLTLPSAASMSVSGGGNFTMVVTGTVGPDYTVWANTNLTTATWTQVFVTNSPVMPFTFVDTNTVSSPIQRFYQISVGP